MRDKKFKMYCPKCKRTFVSYISWYPSIRVGQKTHKQFCGKHLCDAKMRIIWSK